jgi:hypothetical protein
MAQEKLFMVLLGSKAPGRHVEQHDFFFGIGAALRDLVPDIKAFWPEAGNQIHIDAWREVTVVDGHRVTIVPKDNTTSPSRKRLFFINLGGYQQNKFEEQHYTVLTVKEDKASAFKEAKNTLFFKHNHIKGASSHIDDKYGIDVDDLYEIDEMLSPQQKGLYQLELIPTTQEHEDTIHLGYFKLNSV